VCGPGPTRHGSIIMNETHNTAGRPRRRKRGNAAGTGRSPEAVASSEAVASPAAPRGASRRRGNPAATPVTKTADQATNSTPAKNTARDKNTSDHRDRPRRRAAGEHSSSTVTGTLRVHPRGFGFLVREDSTGDDVFVPGNLLKGLCDADLVEAKVGRGDAAVSVRLLQRTRREFLGTVSADGASVLLDPGVGVDSFALSSRLTPGETVVFSFNSSQAVVVRERLKADSTRAGMLRFLMRHRIPLERPKGVEAEAGRRVRLAPLQRRRDLRNDLVVTVDDDSSRDLDDALSARVEPDGSVRVWVHIADVAEHVLPGSAVDRAAAEVPTSVYLPQGVRHMLPDALGASTLSLLPGQERDTLCVEFRIDQDGEVRGVDIYEARIRTRCRLNYGTVARVLENRSVELAADVVSLIKVLGLAAGRLDLVRNARGGLDSVRADQGRQPGDDDQAHQLIERLMVATNEAVAAWLDDRGAPALWRRHDPITDTQVEEILAVAEGFGVVTGLAAPVTPRALAVAVSRLPAGAAGAAFWDALLGALGRAYYSVDQGGHFGLASDGYLHFTSPLRRYPDLMVHRVVKAYLSGRRDLDSMLDTLTSAATAANDVFRRASFAERDAVLADGLSDVTPGEVLAAIVVGPARSGTRVRLERQGVTAVLHGRFRSGERLDVKVVKVDPHAGRIELRPAKEEADAPRARRSRGSARA
jgi:ribonuclease R